MSTLPVPVDACLIEEDYFVWGASMVRDSEGTCHLFYSRWPREAGFKAWVTHSEIAHAVAANPLGPYTHVDVALPARGAEFWDGCCTHNPTILSHAGKSYLYYMGNTGDGKAEPEKDTLNWLHRNNQRIGVAVADHPSGPWRRSHVPLINVSADPAAADSLVVTNPSVTRRPDGSFLMIYKAVGTRDPLPFGGPVVHRIALSDRPDGPFAKQPELLFTRGEARFPAEDPFVWVQEGRYYAILKDMEGAFTGAGRSLVLFVSDDGRDWQLADPCLVSDRHVKFENGQTRQYDYLERPQLYLENGKPSVLFCAARDGDRAMNIHIPLRAHAEDS